MGIYLGSIILSFLTVPFVVLTKRRFEECLPVAALSSIVFLFAFGICGALRIAVPALMVLAVIGLGLSIFIMMKQKKSSDVISRCI